MSYIETTGDLSSYSDTTYQVWVATPSGGAYLYLANLPKHGALRAVEDPYLPDTAPKGSRLIAVKADTTYTIIGGNE